MTDETKPKPGVYTHHREQGGIIFSAPYFQMLLKGETADGRLPRDFAAHACWHYFCLASAAKKKAEECMVLENEQSPVFDEKIAMQIWHSVCMMHGVRPEDMGRYWEVVNQQRFALRLTSNADLPRRFQFKE